MADNWKFKSDDEKAFWDKCFIAALPGSDSFRAEAQANAALKARRERENERL